MPGTGGTENGTSVDDIDSRWLNDGGDVAFEADLSAQAPFFEGSLFLKPSGKPLRAFILKGDTVPALVGGTVDGIHVGRPTLINNDTIAFTLAVSGGAVEDATGTEQIGRAISLCAEDGTSAPDTIGTISGPSGASLAGNTVLFHTDIVGDESTTGGMFVCANHGQLGEVVRTSDTNPSSRLSKKAL